MVPLLPFSRLVDCLRSEKMPRTCRCLPRTAVAKQKAPLQYFSFSPAVVLPLLRLSFSSASFSSFFFFCFFFCCFFYFVFLLRLLLLLLRLLLMLLRPCGSCCARCLLLPLPPLLVLLLLRGANGNLQTHFLRLGNLCFSTSKR